MLTDLHTHTYYSDGSLSPQELISLAQKHQVGYLGITDHDTIDAVNEASQAASGLNLTIVPGVELSIDYPLEGTAHLHLLGLFIDTKNPLLLGKMEWLRQGRLSRAEQMVQKIASMGHPISWAELEDKGLRGSIGRPHIAQLMVEKGIITNIFQAFNRWLNRGGPAYVPKTKMKIDQAIEVIHQAGGLAILAHPFTLGFVQYDRLGREILKLKEMGLDGLEVYYPSHSRYFRKFLLDFARRERMCVSGGSDFHGKSRPGILPGRGNGSLQIGESVAQALEMYRKTGR